MKAIINDTTYIVFYITEVELNQTGNPCHCGYCGCNPNHGYLIPVENELICAECFHKWINDSKETPISLYDIPKEANTAKYFIKRFGLEDEVIDTVRDPHKDRTLLKGHPLLDDELINKALNDDQDAIDMIANFYSHLLTQRSTQTKENPNALPTDILDAGQFMEYRVMLVDTILNYYRQNK